MPDYLARPLFPQALNLTPGDQAFSWDDSPVDIGLNGPATLAAQTYAGRTLKLDAAALSAAEREAVEDWLATAGHSARSVWLPCELGEATSLAIENVGLRQLRITGQGWAAALALAPAIHLRLLSPDGAVTPVQVTAATTAGQDEIITLSAWPTGFGPRWHVARLLLCRLLSVEWQHEGEGRSDLKLSARELPLEYAAPATADAAVHTEVWLYTLTRRSTASAVQCWRLTSAPEAITHSGNVFSPAQIDHDSLATSTEGDTDSLTLQLGVWAGNPFLGWYPRHSEGSYGVVLERVGVNRATGLSVGTASRLFRGEVTAVVRKGPKLTATCRSPLALNATRAPGFLIQTPCNYALYDANTCGVNEATYRLSGTLNAVNAAAATVDFDAAGLSGRGADYLLRGVITITVAGGGIEVRYVRQASILTSTRHRLTLNQPTVLAAASNSATASPGCDKSFTSAAGCPRFSNTARFGGHPFLPSYNPSVAAIKPPASAGAGKK